MSDASFARLFCLLQTIPAYPGAVDTTQIATLLAAEGFDTTARTVQRDLIKLEGMGYGLECVDTSKPYRWRFRKGAPMRMFPGMDISQALALLLVESHLKRLVPRATWGGLRPHLEAAHKIVEGKPARRWVERVRVVPRAQPLTPPHVDVDVLDAVQRGLVDERQVKVRYKSGSDKETGEMIIHPFGLIVRDVVSYVVGSAFDYSDIRLFALHRMKDASTLTDKAREPPADFDLDAFVENGETGWRLAKDPVALELHFRSGAERTVLESPLSKDQTMKRQDDVAIVKATVVDTRVLRSWLLSFGASVEVRRPRSMRSELATALAEAVARYRE